MRVEVVTSCSVDGYALYGKACVRSYLKYWPFPLKVYTDSPLKIDGVTTKLTGQIAGWPHASRMLPFYNSAAEKPASYLWNAQRYAVKPFVWHDAARKMESGILAWLDADTVTTGPVPTGILEDMLGEADVAYLGRGDMHPENGCVVFRLPEAMPLLSWCRKAYQKDRYLSWHDGWTDCHALREGLRAVPTRSRDLTSLAYPGEWRSHVDAFALSPLGPYVIHLKGRRQKYEGRLIQSTPDDPIEESDDV